MIATRFLVCALLLAPPALAPQGPRVECLRPGQGRERGFLLGIEADQITLGTDAAEQTYRLESFREAIFEAEPMTGLDPTFRVRLEDGSELMVHRIGPDGHRETLRLEGYGLRAELVPLERVRSVATRQFFRTASADEKEDFGDLQEEPPRTSDLLLAMRDGERTRASVVVTGMSHNGVTVSIGDKTRTVPWDNVGWVVLARTGPEVSADRRHLVALACGSTARAESLRLEQGTLTATAGGAEYTIDIDRLRRIRVSSDAYRYLSDVTPESVETEPYLDVVWPPRPDACVTGAPLRLDGATCPKGLGMHGRTRMSYTLGAPYDRFYATLGVDDAAGPRGSVMFRILGDGRELLRTDPMTGDAPARRVALDIAGVERLTLIADWGDPVVGSGNFADWAEARVVRHSPEDGAP